MSTDATPSALGGSLKRAVEAHFRLGRAAKWTPVEGSIAYETWQQASTNALALTVSEADTHASALSSLLWNMPGSSAMRSADSDRSYLRVLAAQS